MRASRRLQRLADRQATQSSGKRGDGQGLVSSAPRLVEALRRIQQIAESKYGALYERQNRSPSARRLSVGPPGRPQFRRLVNPRAELLNFASNSYLGLADDPRVHRAVDAAIRRYGTHTGGSRLFCGTAEIHVELEDRLARFLRAENVFTFTSGYVANVTVVSALFGPEDAVILDRNAHRSLYDGVLLSGAALFRFAHNDVGHLEHILQKTDRFRRRLVAVDAVYSMEGDTAPVGEISALAHRRGAFVLVDEAHAIGVLGESGRGSLEHFKQDSTAIDIRTGTLSKAIPSVGGFVAASPDVVLLLRYASHGAVFSAALTPADAAAANAAIEILEAEPERVARVRHNAAALQSALGSWSRPPHGGTAIVPILIGDRMRTLDTAVELLERGLFVNAVIPPGVPRGGERLRCFAMASHTSEDTAAAANLIRSVLDSRSLEVAADAKMTASFES
jgi:8-amino-7-oxononanoate synthase